MHTERPADVRINITRHGKYKDWVVAYGAPGGIPKQFYARVQRPGWPIITVHILVDFHGQVQCDRLVFERPSEDEPGILAKDVAAVPIPSLIQWVIGEALGYMELTPEGTSVRLAPGTATAAHRKGVERRHQREVPLGRPRTSAADRQRVLELWEQAANEHWNNAAARIGRAVGLSRSKVYEIRNEERQRNEEVRGGRPRRTKE